MVYTCLYNEYRRSKLLTAVFKLSCGGMTSCSVKSCSVKCENLKCDCGGRDLRSKQVSPGMTPVYKLSGGVI